MRWKLKLRVQLPCYGRGGYGICQCVRLHVSMSCSTLLSRRNISFLVSIGVCDLIASNRACQANYWRDHSSRSVIMVTTMIEMACCSPGQDMVCILPRSYLFLCHHPSMIEGFDLSLHLFEHILLFPIYHFFLFEHSLCSPEAFLQTCIVFSIKRLIAAVAFFIFKIGVYSIFLLVILPLFPLRYERRDELTSFFLWLPSLFGGILLYLLIGGFMLILSHHYQLTQLSFIDNLRVLAKLAVVV